MDIYSWEVLWVAGFFLSAGAGFINQSHILKLIQNTFGQTDWNLVFFAQGFCRVRPATGSEPFADRTQDDGAEEVMESPADIGCFLSEVKSRYVLADVAHFGSEQTDAPGYLCPQKEQRNGGKASVDGIVVRDPYLAVDVEILEGLKSTSGQNARQSGMC